MGSWLLSIVSLRRCLDSLSRAEHRRLTRKGDNRMAGYRYLWLTGQERLTKRQRERLEKAYSELLETGEARAFKEWLRDLCAHSDAMSATEFFRNWYRRVIQTKLTPMKKVTTTIRERLGNVDSTCVRGITNAVTEGIQDHVDQTVSWRLSQPRELQNSRLVLLR
jgi:transposase